MVFLETPKRFLKIIGILPISKEHLPNFSHVRENQAMVNAVHIVFILICLALYISSVLYFLFCKAKTFAEYSETALFLVVTVTRILFYFIMLSKKKEMVALIADLEDTIENRNLKLNFDFRLICEEKKLKFYFV